MIRVLSEAATGAVGLYPADTTLRIAAAPLVKIEMAKEAPEPCPHGAIPSNFSIHETDTSISYSPES